MNFVYINTAMSKYQCRFDERGIEKKMFWNHRHPYIFLIKVLIFLDILWVLLITSYESENLHINLFIFWLYCLFASVTPLHSNGVKKSMKLIADSWAYFLCFQLLLPTMLQLNLCFVKVVFNDHIVLIGNPFFPYVNFVF